MFMRSWIALVLVSSLGLFGCSEASSDSNGSNVKGGGSGSANGSGGSGASSGSSSGSGAANGFGGASNGFGGALNLGGSLIGGGTGGGGNGMAEVCDGIDNDENGIIDDVDVGGDGVCDCLNIATIGQIGPWNEGNIFVTWLNERSPQGAVALDDQVLTEELLAPFQIIVALHVAESEVSYQDRVSAAHHPFSDEEAAAFKAWVENGGGAMTTIGYTGDEASEVVNINRLLSTVGLGYSTTKLGLSGYVQTWEPHPVTEGVSNIFTDNGVEPEGSGTTIASANGAAALQVAEVMNGRVVVWGDEWITYDSQWQDVEDQQVELFWLNILKWLSPPNECQVAIPPIVH